MTATIDKKARKLCTHTIVYTDVTDIRAAALGMQGRTTRAIARELGISEAQAQYRIAKAQKSQKTRFRRNYRDGTNPLVAKMLRATQGIAMRFVQREIAPKFIPLARPGVPRS